MANPIAKFSTTMGDFSVELYADKSPITVANFVKYANAGFYNGTIFHRVIPGFVVQGGGMLPGLKEKDTEAPIKNEADNGVSNKRGTIAMARTMDPHSATSQFFLNLVDNKRLDHSAKDARGWGYCAFGMIVDGLETIDKIAAAPTGSRPPHDDVPKTDVVLSKVEIQA